MRLFVILLGMVSLMSSCTKETMETITGDMNPTIGEVPEISLVGVNLTEVIAYQDSLVFTISYQDGDGDLGSSDADKMNIELIDQRDPENLIFGYHFSPRAPEGSEITIQGELEVVLNNTILLDDENNSETTTFSIRIQDEAGNWSNEVASQDITINKD